MASEVEETLVGPVWYLYNYRTRSVRDAWRGERPYWTHWKIPLAILWLLGYKIGTVQLRRCFEFPTWEEDQKTRTIT